MDFNEFFFMSEHNLANSRIVSNFGIETAKACMKMIFSNELYISSLKYVTIIKKSGYLYQIIKCT